MSRLPPPLLEMPLPGRAPAYLTREALEPAAGPAPSPRPERRPKVLVVEDNGDYRNIVSLLLRGDGMEVFEAGDGKEAIPLALRHKPDLVILDFNMPRMNGFELLRELRANEEVRRVPIILFTGSPYRRQLREMDLDVCAFLDKPVPNKTLLEHVRETLSRAAAETREAASGFAAPAPAPARPAEETPPPPPPPPVHAPETPRTYDAVVLPPIGADPLPPEPAPAILPPIGVPASPESAPAAVPEPAPLASTEMTGEGRGERRTAPPAPSPVSPPRPAPVFGLPEPDELIETDDLVETKDEEREQQRLERERGLEASAEDSPLVKRVHQLLVQAVTRRASDIHIERQEDCVEVRFRIDGSLVEVCSLPASIHPRLTTRIKIMANLVITEHRLPQDGQFQAQIRGRKVQFRVSTLPSAYGENIVLRALSSGGVSADLNKLGFQPRDFEVVQRTLRSPHGLILVTGPTGSGKTSTLYSMLSALNKPDTKVLTAEDPIEYRLPGITQVQVRPDIGLKFETALRAFLRQDPDVMLVGEIRDLETADIAVKASITGHLVLSTLHTNSAPASVARLVHMGLQPFLIAASTKLIIAQRLVRKLCAGCRVPATLSAEDQRALTEKEQAEVAGAMTATGCQACAGSGYTGRMPVFEVMGLNSAEIREAVQKQAVSVDQLTEIAIRDGMTPLRQAALRAVAAGETSLTEAYKVIFSE